MGAHVSSLEPERARGAANDAEAFRRAWRDGVPFTLLHDEAFVHEKHQEISASKPIGGSHESDASDVPLISGTNGVPMDELQQVADLARIKLFSKRRKPQVSSGAAQQLRSIPRNARTGSAAASDTADSDPAASVLAAATADKILSRESAESLVRERVRKQRVEIVEFYFAQLGERLRAHDAQRDDDDTSTSVNTSLAADASASATPLSSLPAGSTSAPTPVNHLSTWSGSPSGVFTVASFRVQLEMLREFCESMPRLFENSVLSIVQTLLDFPSLALQSTALSASEHALVADVHAFCESVLRAASSSDSALESQRHVTLLLLLAFGVSCGRASLLVDFTEHLVLGPTPANGSLLLRGRPFDAWVETLLVRMESYRVDVALGAFEDGTLVKQFPVKLLQPSVDDNDVVGRSSTTKVEKLPGTEAIATDGNFVYAWSVKSGLLKIGTGLNFTIAGRVYAESSSSVYAQGIRHQRVFHAALGGSGRDVTDVVANELRRRETGERVDSEAVRVSELLATGDLYDIISSFIPRRLFVMYQVNEDGGVATAILSDDDRFDLPRVETNHRSSASAAATSSVTRVLAAFYGDFEVLRDDAVNRLRRRFEVASTSAEDNSGDAMVRVSLPLLADLLAGTNKAGDVTDATELIVFYTSEGDVDDVMCSSFRVGDEISDVDDKPEDIYLSSLVLCGDSLYLSLLCTDSDRINELNPKHQPRRKPRRLVRISTHDLSVTSVLSLPRDASASTPAPTARPLVTYVSEGLRIYEVEVRANALHVHVFEPSASVSGALAIDCVQAFAIDIESIECTYVVSFFLLFLTHELGATDTASLPILYTNGKCLAIVVPVAFDKSHCLMFDLETLAFVGDAPSTLGGTSKLPATQPKCIETTIAGRHVCFDAKNNVLWSLDSVKGSLAYYRNPGLRIAMAQRVAPAQIIAQAAASSGEPRTTPQHDPVVGFHDVVKTRVLGFLAENAESCEPDEWPALVGASLVDPATAVVPFVADLQSTSFSALLTLLKRFAAPFQANTASVVDCYCLQATLSILNAHVTLLFRVRKDASTTVALDMLRQDLSPLLNALIYASHGAAVESPELLRDSWSAGAQTDRVRLGVISKALDLYATCTRIFHPDVVQQFDGVLTYLKMWTCRSISATELKTLERLLGHLSDRTSDLQRAILASNETLETFKRVVEYAVALQKQQLEVIFAHQSKLSGDKHAPRMDDSGALVELTLLVNSVSQSLLLSLSDSPHEAAMADRMAIVFSLFHLLRDGCNDVCSAAAAHIEATSPSRKTWTRAEHALRRGFFGVIAPMLFASALVLVRNREHVLVSATASALMEFVQENASKLTALLKAVETVTTMVEPSARQQTVESVVVDAKFETMESAHEYENDKDEMRELRIPGATRLIVTFDAQSRTELNYDYVTFYKDQHKREYYGEQSYSGRDAEHNWPGVGANAPLVIESDHCFVAFHSDSSNTDWGYKFTARGEILKKKASVKRHWLVFLAESIVHVLDESVGLLVDGSAFAPIADVEFQHERFLQSDLVKGGLCAEQTQNTNVLELLRAFASSSENARAEKVVSALMHRSGTLRQRTAPSSFTTTSEPSANQSVNTAVRAVAAAILHHNMWGMDAYAFAEGLRSDVSDQLLRGWKNAQKMRDWFHLGDAADASMQRPGSPSRRGSRKLRRQPSAFKGISEESLQILCDNVVERAQFLLDLTPASFSYVSSAKRRWGLLAKYGHAIGKVGSSESAMDKWYNLLDELQAATELRSLFQYRRNSSERMRSGQTKSVTEQVLEFIQSDVDVHELRRLMATRNVRAQSRAFGIDLFVQTWRSCSSTRVRAALAESLASTMKKMVQTYSSTGGASPSPVLARVHFATKLSGCDESLRLRVSEAYGRCLSEFASLLSAVSLDSASCSVIVAVLKSCALDFDVEDSYLLHDSRILTHVLRLLSTDAIQIRRAAQSLLGVFLARFVVGKATASADGSDQQDNNNSDSDDDVVEATAFQRQLFAAVGFQLEGVAAQARAAMAAELPDADTRSSDSLELSLGGRDHAIYYLPDESPGVTAASVNHTQVHWNHSIMLWVFVHGESAVYALKVGDEVRRGPNWKDSNDDVCGDHDVGVVAAIVESSRVQVRWGESAGEHVFDPKAGVFEVILVDQGVGGAVFVKGNKTMVKDTAFATPWSSFGLYLNNQRQLSYKIARGGDRDCVYDSNYELEVNEWSHVAIVQERETLKLFVNGVLASHHLLDPFLLMHGHVNASEAKVVESVHPYPDAVDQYWPVHIPGASKIRVTFDPMCDIDQSTGFVRFYKNARCNDVWGDDRYSGKYHDPERNFPGAQSGRYRGRRNSIAGASAASAAPSSVEILSDRFLVYFHNEGKSNGWGFRLLAVPEYPNDACFDPLDSASPAPSRFPLNPHAFYFGEPPCRVMDESAAKCSIYQPKVCDYAVDESELTLEIQASCPSAELEPTVVPRDRALHILSLLQTCSETPFGRSLIATPENVGNLLALALGANISTVLQCASLANLRELVEFLSPDVAAAQLKRVDPSATGDLVERVFAQISAYLDVWSNETVAFGASKDEGTQRGSSPHGDADQDVGLLQLRKSAQEATSLVAAYISLLRSMAAHFDWSERIFTCLSTSLTAIQSFRADASDLKPLGRAIASCAVLGGTYGGVTVGGRVTCCVNIDGKETVETGYVLQLRLRNGVRSAQVLFDCDRSRPIDVPVGDVAHLADEELDELAHFHASMAPFADRIKDLFTAVLAMDVSPPSGSDVAVYKPKVTRKENVEVLESEHPYLSGEDVTYPLDFGDATEIAIYFDKQSCTAGPNDFVAFLKRSDASGSRSSSRSREHWGDAKYFGGHFPGVGATPPLRIPAASVDVHFHTDASPARDPSEWGFKLTAHAFEETLSLPPEIPPPLVASCLSDVRARCVKAISSFVRLQKRSDVALDVASLVPALTRIANAPSDGRPTCSTPRSQVFESKHPYASSVLEYMEVTFRGASKLTVTFDRQSRTELGCDYLSFFKDRSLTERWGESQYSGDDASANWPGVGGRPPLVIPSDSFTLFWCTDVSNVDWGWKFTVTAEFEPVPPLSLSLAQLDTRSYHLFEILYERPSPQRVPYPQEFEGYERIVSSDEREQHRWRNDPVHKCLAASGSAHVLGRAALERRQLYAVVDTRGARVYRDQSQSDVVGALALGERFRAAQRPDGWLELLPDEALCGWVQQRSDDALHVASVDGLCEHENLLVLGVDDVCLEAHSSVLEMNESNEEQDALASFFSQFAFESLKGQCDRFHGFAYDAHRAFATKCAREAILGLLACCTSAGAIRGRDFVDDHEFLLLLAHVLPRDAASRRADAETLELLASTLTRLVDDPANATFVDQVVTRCLQLVHHAAALLPSGRGALRVIESEHPYDSNTDQAWQVSIAGAKRIVVTCDARSKCESGNAWLRFYKAGSNRSETFGEPEFGGRGDSENWPGCAGRPPLVIEADAFEAHFHSESSQNDWGFKLQAIGVFEDGDETTDARQQRVDTPSAMQVLTMSCWLLEVLSERAPRSGNRALCHALYSARVASALVRGLSDLPQQLQPRLLQVLTNLAQDSVQFHRLPPVLVEQLRALVDAKRNVQFAAEEASAVKSHFLQTLVQCAITVDLAIESSRFRDLDRSLSLGIPAPQAMALVADADSSRVSFEWMGGVFRTARVHQYQVLLTNVTAPFSAVVWTRSHAPSGKARAAIEWDHDGNVTVLNARTSEHVRLPQHASPLRAGDVATFQLDFDQQTLVLRKNGLVAGVVASLSTHIDDATRWSDVLLSALESAELASGARSASASDIVQSWSVPASPLALLQTRVVPTWYSKLLDSVAAMVAFHDSRAGDVAVRESAHPMETRTEQSSGPETLAFPGAVALEVKLDRRTKLAKTDELQFQWPSGADDARESSSVRFAGVNGGEEYVKSPMLFLSESHKRNDLIRVGDVVLRSRDWEFGDEDGGVGSVGTVEEIVPWKGQTGAGVRVLWRATGRTRVYRYGFNGRFDVQRCARTSARDLPFVIPGDSLSFSFQSSDVDSSAMHVSALALADEVHDFAGSLRLDTATLTLRPSPPGQTSALTGDSTLEVWMRIAMSMPDQSERDDSIELVSLESTDASTAVCVRASCSTGAVSVTVVDASSDGDGAAHTRASVLENDVADKSSSVAFGQWLHLAIVFAGSKIALFQNGDPIFRAAWGSSAFACGAAVFGRQSQRAQAPPPCIYVYDVRVWDAALRTEQLKSHAKGLDAVSNAATQVSSPALPAAPWSSKQQAVSPFLVPPSPPSSPSRSAAVPSHLAKWTTTNRTGKELVSVRLSASIPTRATTAEHVIYYEAYPLASGKVSIGWMWTHAAPSSGEFVLGQSDDSFGIEPQQRLAHFGGTTSELKPFTAVERSAPNSPRRSSNRGGSSFSSDVWCRDGDVIGCALALHTRELRFFINGELVASTSLHGADQDAPTSAGGRLLDDARAFEGDEAQSEFDQLVDELCSIGFSRRSSTEAVASSGGQSAADAVSWLLERDQNEVGASAAAEIAAMPRKRSARSRSSSSQSLGAASRDAMPADSAISPAATLGAQGAQGIVWNFGAGAFKYQPAALFGSDPVHVQSVIEAAGCPAEQLHFEVFDHLEARWQRVAYRHKVQSISPQMLGWWRLDDGAGAIARDMSGSGNDGALECLASKANASVDVASAWDPEISPPSAALRRNSDALASPFRTVESVTETGERSRDSSSASRASRWGYRFFVIPHYSLDTIGSERLIEQRVRFGGDRHDAQLRHDKHLVKFVNQVAQARHMSVSQLLRAAWSEIAPTSNELVRWPVLLEIATGVAPERESADASSVPASVDSVSHERLAKRFQVLQDFNAAVHRVLPYVNFRARSTSSAATSAPPVPQQEQQICDLVALQRHRIFNPVKRVVWDEALERTVQASVVLELTLSRPKAMRHRSIKKLDVDGRYALFSQAFRQLNSLSGAHYRRADNFYHVSFLGENAQDAGGPYRETLAQYCEELHSSQLPLLLPTSNSQHNVGVGREKWVLNPGASSATMLQMYEFLGKLMGVVLRSKQYLSLHIASMIWKLLVGESLHIDDLAAVDSMIVNSMQKMRTIDAYGVTEEMFEDIVLEVFTTLSSDNYVVPLKPRGETIAVTFANRCEYADLVEQYRFHEFDVQAAALLRGISTVVPAKLLACFTGTELELMVCGSPEIDVDLLERCTEYSSCSASDEHIVWFWQVLRGFSHDERSAFLRFVWGRSRLPATEKEFPQLFKLQSFNKAQAGRTMDAYLPIAHTCFFSVEMPTYSSEHVLRDKLLYAIYNCQEIDGDGDSVAANQLGWEE